MQKQPKEFSEEQRRALRQVYRYLLSIKKERGEETTDTDTSNRNAAYEGMTYEERLKAVYKKFMQGELYCADMTQMEWFYFRTAMEVESRKTDNFLDNIETHRLFWRRMQPFWQYLSKDEKAAIIERLEFGLLSLQELDEIRHIFETARWATLQGREQDHVP